MGISNDYVVIREDNFEEAERWSLALDRTLSLGLTLGAARRAQHAAAARNDFDQATQFRNEAIEAEAWLAQAARDASVRCSEHTVVQECKHYSGKHIPTLTSGDLIPTGMSKLRTHGSC